MASLLSPQEEERVVPSNDDHHRENDDGYSHVDRLRPTPLLSRRKRRAFGHSLADPIDNAMRAPDSVFPVWTTTTTDGCSSAPKEKSLFAENKDEEAPNMDGTLHWSDDDDDGDEEVFEAVGEDAFVHDSATAWLLSSQSPSEKNSSEMIMKQTKSVEEDEEDNIVEEEEEPNIIPEKEENDATAAADRPPPSPVSTPPPSVVDWEDVLASTEALFSAVPDPTTVTVQDILQSLAAEYDAAYIFRKEIKKRVRARLVELMLLQQQHDSNEIENEEDETANNNNNIVQDEDIGENEEEDSDVGAGETDSEEEEQYPSDHDEDEAFSNQPPKPTKRRAIKKKKKKNDDATPPTHRRRRSRPPTKASSAQLALRVHAEQRRKRRLEELRVRNEELALHQSAVDRERAAQIAAQFQTQTAALRRQRLEQRLDLAEKLNQTRLRAVRHDALAATVKQPVAADSDVPPTQLPEEASKVSEEEDEEDEDELEIEGLPSSSPSSSCSPPPPSGALSATRPSTTQLPPPRPNDLIGRLLDRAISPRRNRNTPLDPRAALRQCLQERQRSMGNRWLARELGYPTEEEHIQVCLAEEQAKRERIFQREQARVQADQERSLRLLNDEVVEEEEEEEAMKDDVEETELPEEDEEMVMARDMNAEEEGEMEEPCDPPDDAKLASTSGNDDDDASAVLSSEHPEVTVDMASEMEPAVVSVLHCLKPSDATATPSPALVSTVSSVSPEAGPIADVKPTLDDGPSNDRVDATNEIPAKPSDASWDEPEDTMADPLEAPEDATTDSLLDSSKEILQEDASEVAAEEESTQQKPKGPRNSAWQAILKQDAEKAKKKKRSQWIEEEADEEEEEEVAGLEDFGFVVHKKKKDDDEEDNNVADFDEDDLENVVDDLSDDEGDELAGTKARKAMEALEEKERHKEMLRRMRDGYDGRRGGIAGGGAGARGVHRFDQLVAAENREDAKLLGLLNDDEMDSDNEEGKENTGDNEEDDEHVLLDKMLKARFLHRSSVEEEVFSEDEDAEDAEESPEPGALSKEDEEEKEQERLAKRFAKRARMQRLIELHGHEVEFSQSKLMDDDADLKLELQNMKNGLTRKRSDVSSNGSHFATIGSNAVGNKKQKLAAPTFATSLLSKGGSLAIALQTNRRSNKSRTTFIQRGNGSSVGSTSEVSSSFQKCIAFNNHVVFHSMQNSKSQLSTKSSSGHSKSASGLGKVPPGFSAKVSSKNSQSDSLFAKLAIGGYSKKR